MKSLKNTYACDFETVTYEGQLTTEVWSSAICPICREPQEKDVIIHHRIEDTYNWLQHRAPCIMYYHNLRFDGSFWIDFLLKNGVQWCDNDVPDGVLAFPYFRTLISDVGQWYFLKIYFSKEAVVSMYDSLKLLPYSLANAARSFKTKHQKLTMTYEGKRYAGCEISDEEKRYIQNDVLVLSELIYTMYSAGLDQLTIGGCCVSQYKKLSRWYWDAGFFPELSQIEINSDLFGADTADEYIRRSYRGGWCYCDERKSGKLQSAGCTADVNSLYPSMMHSKSGNVFPVGPPHFWRGSKIPKFAMRKENYYFIRIKCAFKLKKNCLPWMQIKGSPFYPLHEMLKDSKPQINGKKYDRITGRAGQENITDEVTITLTCTDYEMLHKYYDVSRETILDGCWFFGESGIFDDYINKYMKIKAVSKDAERQQAKLMLNSLYGKFGSSINSSYKEPYLEDGKVKYRTHIEFNRKGIDVAIASAITSYARRWTITAAQANYDTFCYADTDSIHCTCKPDDVKCITIHDTHLCAWKIESTWSEGYFLRPKTYIEHTTEDKYIVRCAGMNDVCKKLLIQSMTQIEDERIKHEQKYNEYKRKLIKENDETIKQIDYETEKFLSVRRNITDLKEGLTIFGKLVPKVIEGGTILVNSFYTVK